MIPERTAGLRSTIDPDMTPELVPDSEPQPKGLGEGSRLIGVFFEPAKTFEDVAARPNFWAPLILVIVVSLIYMVLYGQHVGWERMIRQQTMASPQAAQLPADQLENRIQIGAKVAPFLTYGAILLGVPLFWLIWSAVLLGIVKGMMSVPLRLKQVFAILSYASIPGVIMAVLAIAVMFMKPPEDFNLQNPLFFNPGAMMDQATSSKFVYSLASSLDLFRLWTLVLIGIGLKSAGGKLLSMGGAMTAVFLPWAIWILCGAALAGVFGR
jgi:Yip1 domain